MNKRYTTWNDYLRDNFGEKVFKVPIDAGFDCPNRDGTVAHGGCTFCSVSGSGDMIVAPEEPIAVQVEKEIEFLHQKWPGVKKYIAYFQARTNTYAPLNILKEKYEEVLRIDNVIGLFIATRCDAITKETLDYLEELNKRTFLVIELGLQTIHESTSKLINRGHTLKEFDDMVKKLRNRNINVVVHIINGLPYETEEMMLDTVKHLNNLDIQGIKIHMLNICKDTPIETLYNKEHFHILTKEEYIDIVIKQLELLREEIVIHRITSDPDKDSLIEPTWLLKKFCLLNDIDKEMKKRDTYQGKYTK